MIVLDAVQISSRTSHPRWLLRPTILPDELAHSYAYRVLVLNAAESLESLIAAVADTGAVDPQISKPEFLAWVSGLEVPEFIRLHTPVPFQRAFAHDPKCHAHGARIDHHLRYEALRIKVVKFRYCASCFGEDIDFWGFPILRVSQHVTGIDCCEKHSEPLASTGFPTARISNMRAFSWPIELAAPAKIPSKSSKIVERYAEIATALMLRTGPMPVKTVASVISSTAQRAGLRRCQKGRRKLLSDLAMEQVPLDWLERLIPDFLDHKRAPGIYACAIDATTQLHILCRPEAYVLALSILFPTSEAALNTLTSSPSSRTTRAKTTAHKPPTTRRESIKALGTGNLAKLYVQADFRYPEFAQAIDRSVPRVKEILAELRLPPARLIRPKKNRDALLAFKKGASIQAACASTGAPISDLEQLLRCDVDQLVPLIHDRRSSARPT